MASQTKTQLLNEVHDLLKRRYKLEPRRNRLTILEAVIYGICHEGTTREQANQALSRFKDEFFDWNEVRVSSISEIQDVLAGLPDPEGRAQRIRRFLRQLYDKTYGFDEKLDHLHKKSQKDASKALREFEVLQQSDYVLATVVQQALAGHAIPVDEPIRRGLQRLGVAEDSTAVEDLRGTLERAVPKNRGGDFVDLMEELTHDTCVAGAPACPRCSLRRICPTAQNRTATSTSTKSKARTSRGKDKEETAPSDAPSTSSGTKPRAGKSSAPKATKPKPESTPKAARSKSNPNPPTKGKPRPSK